MFVKKLTKLTAGLVLASCAAGITFTSCQKKEATNTVGALSYLRYDEDHFATLFDNSTDLIRVLAKEGYITMNFTPPAGKEMEKPAKPAVRYYDSLESMLLGLKSGEVNMISSIPQSTAMYLCQKDDALKMTHTTDLGKIFDGSGKNRFARIAASWLSDGFAFMFMEKNTALRDQMDKAIEEFWRDRTIQKLVVEHIEGPIKGVQPKPIELENKPGRKTIKIAVTGDLPPMDYIASDGSFAGFNTALLAEIGKKLDVNISMVQVANAGRAAALASGTVDVVFWTRASAQPTAKGPSKEETAKIAEKISSELTVEEDAALLTLIDGLEGEKFEKTKTLEKKDMPDGTIITQPYFKDAVVGVILKK